ncbi:MAG: Hsp20 family protein [Thermodesulfobacteriota bacterium]
MTVSERAREKLDEASQEIREAIDNLKQEVTELTKKVKENLKGTDKEVNESAEALTQEVKDLSQKVKALIPRRRKKQQLPVHVDKYPRVQQDPWEQSYLAFRQATDRLFDDFFGGMPSPMADYGRLWRATPDISDSDWPRVDMSETDEEIVVTAELPGVDREDIDISVSDNTVTIRGDKTEEEEEKTRDYYRLERSYGSFHRVFSLPCEVESDRAKASFKRGILTIQLPKSAEARKRVKRIPIKTA